MLDVYNDNYITKIRKEQVRKRGEVMFELYFQINDNEPELQSAFDTKAEAEKHMQRLIDSKSRIKSWYIREIQHDGYWLYDYGAHNAFYIVKEAEQCK